MGSTGKVVHCIRYVNVRKGPGSRYARIGKARKGAVYAVTGKSGSWYRIDFNKRAGWIYARYLTVRTAPSPTEPSPTGTTGTTPSGPEPTAASPANRIITGYYAGWAAEAGYTPLNIPADKLIHIHYAFANIDGSLKVALGDPGVDPSNFSKLNQMKSQHPGLKTLISVGGWEWSGRFSDAALTASSRAAFADSAIAFIKQYGFDGVDVDWEYPTGGGLSTNVSRPQDKANFTLLMAALRQKLDAQGAADGKLYLLTFAGASQTYYANSTELSKLAGIVDYALLMAYDMHGTWESYTDFNAPLHRPSESAPQPKWSCDDGVRLFMDNGVPGSKIVMGTPFYGTEYRGVKNANSGLYQRYASGASVTYDQAAAYLSNPAYKRFVHPDAKVPWLFDGSTFVTYDDTDSIAQKAAYVKQKGLGGIGVWELSQNKSGALLAALYESVR